jgi:hypothetical protein
MTAGASALRVDYKIVKVLLALYDMCACSAVGRQ